MLWCWIPKIWETEPIFEHDQMAFLLNMLDFHLFANLKLACWNSWRQPRRLLPNKLIYLLTSVSSNGRKTGLFGTGTHWYRVVSIPCYVCWERPASFTSWLFEPILSGDALCSTVQHCDGTDSVCPWDRIKTGKSPLFQLIACALLATEILSNC